jgi:hypothetical protein
MAGTDFLRPRREGSSFLDSEIGPQTWMVGEKGQDFETTKIGSPRLKKCPWPAERLEDLTVYVTDRRTERSDKMIEGILRHN